MKRLILTLKIDKKTKRFKPLKEVTIGVVLKSIEMEKSLNNLQITEQNINRWLDYICSVYGYKFTRHDLENNVNYTELLPLVKALLDYVIETADLQVPSDDNFGEVVPFEKRKQS